MGLIEKLKAWWWDQDRVTIAQIAQLQQDDSRAVLSILRDLHGRITGSEQRTSELDGRIEIAALNIATLFSIVNLQSKEDSPLQQMCDKIRDVDLDYSSRIDRLDDTVQGQIVKLNYYLEKLDKRADKSDERWDFCSAKIVSQSERMDAHEKDCLDYDVVIQEMEDDITESKAVIERQRKQIDKLAATVDTLAKEAFHRVSSPYEPLPPMGITKKRTAKLAATQNTPKKGAKSK